MVERVSEFFSLAVSTPFFAAISVAFSVELNTDFIRSCSREQLIEVRSFLSSKGFEFGVYSDPMGVYYTAQRNGDVAYADVREAYSTQTLRDMYEECLRHLG